jgi:hypothetical protein
MRHETMMLGGAALILAGGLILTGCGESKQNTASGPSGTPQTAANPSAASTDSGSERPAASGARSANAGNASAAPRSADPRPTMASTSSGPISPIEALGSANETERQNAAKALRDKGPEAAPALLSGLNHQNAAIRANCAELLGKIGPVTREVVPALAKKLRDGDASVRMAAALALGEMGLSAESAKEDLIRYGLNDDNPEVALAAEKALDKIEGRL